MKRFAGVLALLALTAGAAAAKSGHPAAATKKVSHPATAHKVAAKPAASHLKEVFTCPVMKSKIASAKLASGYSDYKGTRYYFCCKSCKPAFDKNPAKYVK